jgi:hypothetical protein
LVRAFLSWEHPEVAGETGSGDGGTGVELKSVAVNPFVVFPGGILTVNVAFTGPVPLGDLVVGVATGTTPPNDVSSAFPISSPMVVSDVSSMTFKMAVGNPPPGSYVVSASVNGGAPQGSATFTVPE